MAKEPTALRIAIAASGRTQREVADAIGMSDGAFSRIVNGLHTSDANRAAIAHEIGASVSDLWPEQRVAA
jgi:transcriptional regulator with XRE-family HTH domain